MNQEIDSITKMLALSGFYCFTYNEFHSCTHVGKGSTVVLMLERGLQLFSCWKGGSQLFFCWKEGSQLF